MNNKFLDQDGDPEDTPELNQFFLLPFPSYPENFIKIHLYAFQ